MRDWHARCFVVISHCNVLDPSLTEIVAMHRVWTLQNQFSFAALSGDYNPMHIDPIAARRMLFGRPVVHGIHSLIWAIDRMLHERFAESVSSVRIVSLSVDFSSPILVEDPIELKIVSEGAKTFQLTLSANGSITTTIKLAVDLSEAHKNAAIAEGLPERLACKELQAVDVKSAAGRLPLHFNREAAEALFPSAGRLLVPEQFAALLASTRMVGMEIPGLHSLYTGLELAWSNDFVEPVLEYAAEGFEPRYAVLTTLAVKSPGFRGRVLAAFRPAPSRQRSFAEFSKLVKSDEFAGERALVIGGSRGLGEVAVKSLAAGGAEVRFTYYKGSEDARRIVADVAAAGGSTSCFAYDVLGDSQNLLDSVAHWSPTLLCYFATPHIGISQGKSFSFDRFKNFCATYIDGFLHVFGAVAGGLTSVLYPSSSFVEELPANMGEYVAAKAAAEALCGVLAKNHAGIRFHTPRYPKLVTDQTASLLDSDAGDGASIVLNSLRELRAGTPPRLKKLPHAHATGTSFAIASTFTAEPMESALRFWAAELNQEGPVEFAQFNQVFQALLDPTGLMSRKKFVNAILIRLEDWIEGDRSSLSAAQWNARLKPLADELLNAARAIPRTVPTLVVVCPPSIAVALNARLASIVDDLTAEIVSGLHGVAGVYAPMR